MPTLTTASTDGLVKKDDTTDWATCRDAGTGTSNGATETNNAWGIESSQYSARGGGSTWRVTRSFFAFDTSGVTATVSTATLKIYGYTNGSADIIVVEATRPNLVTGIANADFDAITGFSAGNTMDGNATDYSNEFPTWSTSGYNSISLNGQARSDMVSQSILKVCLVEYDHDYLNVDPGGDGNVFYSGLYYQEYSGTGTDPVIDYTLAGYGHTVTGVTTANISKIKGVATALSLIHI